MKKKWKVWSFVIAAPVVAFGVLLFFGARENPDYVRAAKLLPEAKQRAREVFGPLTWEEYREEKGIVHRDDSSEWKRLETSIPDDLWDFRWLDSPGPEEYGEVFNANRAWLLGLSSETENLVLHQPYPEGLIDGNLIPVKNLINMLETGIIGAADVGDVDAVRRIADTAWSILEKWMEEPDTMHVNMMISGRGVVIGALLTAVVRNAGNELVLAAVRESIANAPTPPDIRDALAGNVRSNREFFRVLLDEGLANLNQTLNAISDADVAFGAPTPATPTLWDEVREYVSGIFNDSANTRRVGDHAIDALAARLWEVQVDLLPLSEDVMLDPSTLVERSKRFDDDLAAKTDLSYEFVQNLVSSIVVRWYTLYDASKDLAPLVLAIISDYPQISLLPESLPAEHLFPDPFGTGPIVYKKTPTGFILYSVYEDGIDGGFAVGASSLLQRKNVNITASENRADHGIVVNYELPKATAPP